MRSIRLKRLLPWTAAACVVAASFGAADATQPLLQPASAAAPAFLHAAALPVSPAAPPAPLLGLPSSVMPPPPPFSSQCSVNAAGGQCSAAGPNVRRCSAANDNDGRCSTFGAGPQRCSVGGPFAAACTVLPPSFGASPSLCSTFNDAGTADCSAFGGGAIHKCSVKGTGLSQCSTLPDPTGGAITRCSVFNPGATTKSYCSTQAATAPLAKQCSTFGPSSQCSIVLGGNGRCTSFNAAPLAACSAMFSGTQCSVIGGASGNPCNQP